MGNISKYPRILMIYQSCLNKADNHGVSIRGWFADWPAENLAQIYAGNEVGEENFCGHNFKLGEKERRFGKYFFKFKVSSLGQSSYDISLDKNNKILTKLSRWSLIKNKIIRFILNTGAWELVFKPKLSKEMIKFVEDFNPQIIYCQGYTLSFVWLPVQIHKYFNVPVCFQTGDDWPANLYGNSLISFVMKPAVRRAAISLLQISSARLTNGTEMNEEYTKRYNLNFEPLMMCDDINRFRDAIPNRVVDKGVISVVYSGGLGHGRWASIIDLCNTAKIIEIEKKYKLMITVFAVNIPPEAINKLHMFDNLQILPNPNHDELPSYLKGADILFLPEAFELKHANDVKLSISTKAHLYMMSEKPIFVYGSSITGVVKYALNERWACVVQYRELKKVNQAIFKLITDIAYRKQLVNRGIEVALINHSQEKIKDGFLSILNKLLVS